VCKRLTIIAGAAALMVTWPATYPTNSMPIGDLAGMRAAFDQINIVDSVQ
jgi:hypothetical protein